MQFICYSRCTTCKRAQKWLDDHGISYELRPIKEENPSEAELREWHKKSGLPLKRFFNTSGLVYKELRLSKKLPEMPEAEQFRLLSSDGMLVKRPLLIDGERILVGFDESEYEKLL